MTGTLREDVCTLRDVRTKATEQIKAHVLCPTTFFF